MEWLERRDLLAVVAPGGLPEVPPSLEPLIPPQVLNEIDALLTAGFESAAIYQAFPGEVNDIRVSTAIFESLILFDDSGHVPVFRVPPVVNKAVLDSFSVGSNISMGAFADGFADVWVAGDIGVAYELTPVSAYLGVGFDVGVDVGVNFTADAGFSVDLPLTEFVGGVPDVEAIAINPGAIGSILELVGLDVLVEPLTPLLDMLSTATSSDTITIPEINIPGLLPLDVLDFSDGGPPGLGTLIPAYDPSIFDDFSNQFESAFTIPEFEIPTGVDIGDVISDVPGLDFLVGLAGFLSSALNGELRVTLDMNDLDDRADLSAVTIPTFVDGGTGNDTVIASISNDEFLGGDQNDAFLLNVQSLDDFDVFDGGDGDDTLLIPGTDTSDVIHLYADNDGNLIRYERHDTQGDVVAATNLVLTNVEEIQILGEEGDQVLGSLGDDSLIIHGELKYSNGVVFFGGDEVDSVELIWMSDAPLEVTVPQLGDDNTGTFLVGEFPYSFTDVEDSITFNANGAVGSISFEGGDESNFVRFVGTEPGGGAFANDGQVGMALAGFAPGSSITMDGLNGGDTFSVALNGITEFTEINILGTGPTGTDTLIFEGNEGDEEIFYTPSPDSIEAGMIEIGATTINFEQILGLTFVGLGGDDTLQVNEPAAGSDDTVFFEPSFGNSGLFTLVSASAESTLVYAPVRFRDIEVRRFNTGTGIDSLFVSSFDMPFVNSDVTVVGGDGTTTVDYGGLNPTLTEFVHDTTDADILSLELSSAHDRVSVTPGNGIAIDVHMGLGDNTLTYLAEPGDNVILDLDDSVLRTENAVYGNVTFTGAHVAVDAGDQQFTAIHTGDDDDILTLEPTGTDTGRLATNNPFEPTVEFKGVTQLFLQGNGALNYQGSNRSDAINIVQSLPNEVDINQQVARILGTVDYVPVNAKGYTQAIIEGGHDVDFFRVEVDQSLAGSTSNELSFAIGGGLGKDQVVVIDDDIGDTILRREETDEQSGIVKVGKLAPVVYDRVEVVKIFPFDPITSGTGSDQLGREVVLEADPLEPNDSRLAAHPVETLSGVNRDPNIGEPGVDLFGDMVLGDEDWVSFKATTTGTYRFFLVFDDVKVLENGQPGLPGDGDLDLTIYDAAGSFLADGKPLDILGTNIPNLTPNGDTPYVISQTVDENGNQVCDSGVRPDPRSPTVCQQVGPAGEFVDIGVEEGTTVYARVRGHTPEAVNNYDVFVLSPLDLAEGTIADQGRDSDLGTDAEEISDPPGGGLRIIRTEINSFDTSATNDRPDCDTGLYNAGCRTIFPTDLKVTPTFQVESITLFVESFPPRAPGFQYEAIHETIAHQLGNYELVGQHSGPIEFDAVTVVNDEVTLGETAKGTVTLHFNAPLPDDRYTLVVRDTLVDPAIRPLDGETNAVIPVDADHFKSGNGVPGGDFIGKFSVDTRVEIGTYYAGSFWLDLNANGIFDPDNPDPLNRDAVYQFGSNEELVDKPVIGDWDGDGFDEIGLFARDASSGTYRFHLDRNSNGIYDPGNKPEDDPLEFEFLPNSGAGVQPVVGDWDGDGTDNIGVLSTGQWILDLDDNQTIDFATELFPTNFTGLPFAGDWDGSGTIRVGAYDLHAGKFQFDINGDKMFTAADDLEIEYEVPGLERPLVGDFDADFDTNIGLLIANTDSVFPGVIAQWLLDLGDPLANPLMELTDAVDGNDDFNGMGSPGDGDFQPAPTGGQGTPLVYQDVFFQVRDARFTPVVGNWDLPLTRPVDPNAPVADPPPPPPPSGNPFHNDAIPTDVNNDGMTTPADANEVAAFLGTQGIQPISALTPPGMFWDVDNDELITPQDYLAVISFLGGGGEGEATQPVSSLATAGWYKNSVEPADVNLDGVVGATDALAIVNQINANGIQMELEVPFTGRFVDPNGDGYVTGRDFLFVANILNNRATGAGEGEDGGEGEADRFVVATTIPPATQTQPDAATAPSGHLAADRTANTAPILLDGGGPNGPVTLGRPSAEGMTGAQRDGLQLDLGTPGLASNRFDGLTALAWQPASARPMRLRDFESPETLDESLMDLLAKDVGENWRGLE